MEDNYWVDFWQNNYIIHKATAQEKVGRTINGVPIEEHKWQEVLTDLEQQLQLKPTDTLLDIGAGSGVVSIPFSKKVKQVVAADISEPLLQNMQGIANITTLVADARSMPFDNNSFDKIVIYFAIQHFSEEETAALLQKAQQWLKPGGILYVGDIPDAEHKFTFFNTPQRRQAYFESLLARKPIIGTWFQKEFFTLLGAHLGFAATQIVAQPAGFINAHYRFDARFVK